MTLACGHVASQQPETVTQTCSFSEIYRKDGWTVPGLRGAKVKKQRATVSNIPGVFVTMMTPSEGETTITQISCSRDRSGQIEIEDEPIGIIDLWAFDFDGRVFAYRLSYERQAMQNGTRVRTGAASADMFYDLDGSGRFTVRKGASRSNYYIPDEIPAWVKTAPVSAPVK